MENTEIEAIKKQIKMLEQKTGKKVILQSIGWENEHRVADFRILDVDDEDINDTFFALDGLGSEKTWVDRQPQIRNNKFYPGCNAQYVERQEFKIENGGNLYYGKRPQEKKTSEETARLNLDDMVMILIDDLLAQTEDGEYIFTEQYQWYAVYRVLSEKLNYTSKMSVFFREMQRLGYNNCNVSCSYPSLKYASQECPRLVAEVDKWINFDKLGDTYHKMYIVADFLIKSIKSL